MGRDLKLGRLKILLGRLFFFCRHVQRVKYAESKNNKTTGQKRGNLWIPEVKTCCFFLSSPQNLRYTKFCNTPARSNPRKFVGF